MANDQRDDFSLKTKNVLARRVGFNCSNCGQLTSGPQEDPSKATNIGVAAHITAASPGGPRYDPHLTPEQRSAITNGIWLCQNCAKLVDNDPKKYPVELLHAWKEKAEKAAADAVEGRNEQAKPQNEPAASSPQGGQSSLFSFYGPTEITNSPMAQNMVNIHQTNINAEKINQLFEPLDQVIQRAPSDKQKDAEDKAAALKDELSKAENSDDDRVAGLLDELAKLVPGAVGTLVSMFASPILQGITGPVTQSILNSLGMG